MRVILIKGQSAYDALRVFIDELGAAFGRLGHEAIIVDAAMNPDILNKLLHRKDKDLGSIDLIFSFNILGEVVDLFGRSLGEMMGAPHVIQYVDYPLTHLSRLDATSRYTALLMVDQSFVNLVHTLFGEDRFAFVGFSPHAAVGETVSPGANVEEFASNRTIPILFPGTGNKADPTPLNEVQGPAKNVLKAAIEIALSKEWVPPLDALDQAMVAFGLDPLDKDFLEFRKSAIIVHDQVRGRRREAFLTTAQSMGIPLHVVGKGYDPNQYKNLIRLEAASLEDTCALMARSRVVANVNANFGAGSHERPFTALTAGAAVASDSSQFYATHFEDGREIALFHWDDLEGGLQAIAKLANDPDAAFTMAQAGQKKVLAEHRWDNRVKTIIAASDRARARLVADGKV